MVQIAFKPLTLKGLPETFLAALRDARNLDFRQSLMGSIESTVVYGPVYFNTQPNLQLSLSDRNILDARMLNVKTHICKQKIVHYMNKFKHICKQKSKVILLLP